MISLRARLIRYLAKRSFEHLTPETDINYARQLFEDTATRLKPPRSVKLEQVTIAGVECERHVPQGCADRPLLYFLHGGAYVMGSSRTHRRMVARMAKAAGVRALLPNYRLAPEHPFPAGIEDASRVYTALLEQGERASRIIIAGDSAGGGLTMATLLTLRAAGVALPAAAILISPWLDLSASGESMHSRAHYDPLFRPHHMPDVANFYCAEHQRRDPRISPVFADVSGLPPVYIQVGDHEILLSDSTRIAEKLRAAGVPVTLQIWPDMWHVFQFFDGQMPEAKRAKRDIAAFIHQTFPDLASGSKRS